MSARIYRPARTATQSGEGRTKRWVLEFDPASARTVEPLMGWTSSHDMNAQVRLNFATSEEAIAYATKKGIDFRVEQPKPVIRKGMSYSDNFKPGRTGQWTH